MSTVWDVGQKKGEALLETFGDISLIIQMAWYWMSLHSTSSWFLPQANRLIQDKEIEGMLLILIDATVCPRVSRFTTCSALMSQYIGKWPELDLKSLNCYLYAPMWSAWFLFRREYNSSYFLTMGIGFCFVDEGQKFICVKESAEDMSLSRHSWRDHIS